MVLVWYAHRKKPRIYRTPQEAWDDIYANGKAGFASTGFPIRIQAWASEMDLESFAHSGEFFPKEFVDWVKESWRRGDRMPMLALVRGLLMYVALRPRWERVQSLVVGWAVSRGLGVRTVRAAVLDAESGRLLAVAGFYGRYPTFTLDAQFSVAHEDVLRHLLLRRIDSSTKRLFQGYIRWVPSEFPAVDEEAEAEEEGYWVQMPEPKDILLYA